MCPVDDPLAEHLTLTARAATRRLVRQETRPESLGNGRARRDRHRSSRPVVFRWVLSDGVGGVRPGAVGCCL